MLRKRFREMEQVLSACLLLRIILLRLLTAQKKEMTLASLETEAELNLVSNIAKGIN